MLTEPEMIAAFETVLRESFGVDPASCRESQDAWRFEVEGLGFQGAIHSADVRVMAATNRNLDQMVLTGTFREDLLYRLNVLRIEVPPLRDRRADIPFLVKRFLDDACENSD